MAYRNSYTRTNLQRNTTTPLTPEPTSESAPQMANPIVRPDSTVLPENGRTNIIFRDSRPQENIYRDIPLSGFVQVDVGDHQTLSCSVNDIIDMYYDEMSFTYKKHNRDMFTVDFLEKTWEYYTEQGCNWWQEEFNILSAQLNSLEGVRYELKNVEKNFINKLNEQCGCGKIPAPEEYSYTQKGTFIKNESLNLYNEKIAQKVSTGKKEQLTKVISFFDIDTGDIDPNGENRSFLIRGDDGAMFSMELFDADNNYYNFSTQTWSSTKYRMKKTVIRNGYYSGQINFSNVASKTHVYTLFLIKVPF